MGLFDKKECDICGEKIGLLGNRKLEDGNMCKDCAKQLSPLFDDRRNSTLEEINAQLAYRKQNEEAVQAFSPTKSLGKDNEIKIDERNGTFIYCKRDNWRDENPDVIMLSQVLNCTLDIKEDEEQIYRQTNDGRESYNPPRYKTTYEFHIDIQIESPWFDDIKFRLDSSFDEIDNRYSEEFRKYEQMGYEICAAFGRPVQGSYAPQQAGYAQQTGYAQQAGYAPQQGGYPPQQGGYPPQQGAYPQQQGGYPPQQGGYPQQQGGYAPQQTGYPQQQGGYAPQQGGYPPQQGGYPPQQGGYASQQGGYAPQQGGYPPQQGGYPQQQGGYPPQQGGYASQQGGYPPQQGGYQQDTSPNMGGVCPGCQAKTSADANGRCPFCGSNM